VSHIISMACLVFMITLDVNLTLTVLYFVITKRSQYSLWIQWPILMCLSLLTGLAGLYMYAYYAGCDPLTAKRIEKADQLLPLMVVDTMSQYPGMIL